MEILSHGTWRLHSDCSKLYLAVMGSYAGVAEISKWAVNAPTDPSEDPAFERLHRGLFFIWLWTCRVSDPAFLAGLRSERPGAGLC